MARAQVIRGANFAHPYSERHEFYSPRTVKILVGISGLIVLLLVLLPFYLQHLRQETLGEQNANTELLNTTRLRAEQARPVIAQMTYLDSIKQALNARTELYTHVASVEYRMDRLVLHISDIVPDGAVLTAIDVRPPQQRQGGRVIRAGETQDVPEELQDTLILTLNGAALNSEVLRELREAMVESPVFDLVQQSVSVLEEGLSFVLTARLPGSGAGLGEERTP
jgi:Tfp pilus assembly protein PilN